MHKFPISLYYILTLVLSFILLIAHFIFPSVGIYSVSFTQLAPALSVFFVSLFLKDTSIWKDISKRFTFKPVFSKWLIIALIVPFLSILMSSYVMRYLGFNFVSWSGNSYFYMLSFIAILIGSVAEEIGWRGYLLPKYQNRFNPFYSSILVGVLWGVWHLNFTGGILGFLLYTITIIEMSICMTWLFNSTNGNLWLMTIWHLVFNLASHIFLWERFNITLFLVESIIFGALSISILFFDKETFFSKTILNGQTL